MQDVITLEQLVGEHETTLCSTYINIGDFKSLTHTLSIGQHGAISRWFTVRLKGEINLVTGDIVEALNMYNSLK